MLDRRWIDGYLEHLAKERRLSPHTSSNYARDIGALADFLERGNVTDWKQRRQPARARVRGALARRRPESAQRAAAAVGGARILRLPGA